MTKQPEYGPWIIWNATDDSACPVSEDIKGQVQYAGESRRQAEQKVPKFLGEYNSHGHFCFSKDVTAYRILKDNFMSFTKHRMEAFCIGENAPMLGGLGHGEGWTAGTAAIDKQDGKVTRIVWEADE